MSIYFFLRPPRFKIGVLMNGLPFSSLFMDVLVTFDPLFLGCPLFVDPRPISLLFKTFANSVASERVRFLISCFKGVLFTSTSSKTIYRFTIFCARIYIIPYCCS